MNNHFIEKRKIRQVSITSVLGICFIMALTVGATAQVNIGGIRVEIKKPDTKKPEPKNPPNTNGNVNTNTTKPQANGPSRELVQAFKEDAKPYREGIFFLKNMLDNTDKSWAPVYNEESIRSGLEAGAGLVELVRQKYPNIADPSWASQFEDKVGTWRQIAETRVEIAKNYLNKRIVFVMAERAKSLDEKRTKIQIHDGFVLHRDFDDKEKLRAELAKEYNSMFALVNIKPDASAFAPYETALDALLDEAKKRAGEWNWYGIYHDAALEAKARSWFKDFEPKGQIVKSGFEHSTWQVNTGSNGIPRGRYKRGYIMYRKPGVEQCVVANFSYEQNYMGGGRYNDMANTSGFSYIARLQSCK